MSEYASVISSVLDGLQIGNKKGMNVPVQAEQLCLRSIFDEFLILVSHAEAYTATNYINLSLDTHKTPGSNHYQKYEANQCL